MPQTEIPWADLYIFYVLLSKFISSCLAIMFTQLMIVMTATKKQALQAGWHRPGGGGGQYDNRQRAKGKWSCSCV
jgi:hypothetical protein